MLEKQLNDELMNIISAEDIPTLINIYQLKNKQEELAKFRKIPNPMDAIKLQAELGVLTA